MQSWLARILFVFYAAPKKYVYIYITKYIRMKNLTASIKNLLLSFCVTITVFSAQAQWVSIPDTNFGKWLNTNGYNMCLQGNSTVGWQMDTTCNEVVNNTYVSCFSNNIKNIEGIQYFDNLKVLYCSGNVLTSLPALPNSLKELWCNNNALTTLPTLPNSLTYLQCYQNPLTVLPTLPAFLEELHCNNNQLTSLPTLPNTLTLLRCYNNQLTALPTLPSSLIELWCSDNLLTSLPTLPSTLTYLTCSNNHLTTLPTLPNILVELRCRNNQLTVLPTLPSALAILECLDNQLISLPALPNALTYLNCFNNQLAVLPALPNSLTYLDCSFNQLTTLPALPSSLIELACTNNLLTSLPTLPDSLGFFACQGNFELSCLPKLGKVGTFFFHNTSIACLPNYPQQNGFSSPPLSSIPLCDVFNANGCDVYYNISGAVYGDSIQNCVKDASEKIFDNIKLLLSRNNILEQQTTTNNFGQYTFDTDLDSFEIRIDTTDLPYTVACPSSFFHTSILTSQDSIDTDKDFGLRCKAGFDIGVLSAIRDSGILFPAQQAGIHVKAGDVSQFYGLNCAAGVSGTVAITYSGAVTFAGAMNGALTPVVSGNTLTYTIADFGAIDMQKAFGLRFLVDTFAQIGQQLCLDITVTPIAGDNNISNNTATYCFEILNSYDPNMKEVSPINSIALTEDWLTYTIHFQNMGNAPAIHIYVLDTLSNNLDESSIQILGSSHRMLTEIKGNIARFNFPNINLVDSITDKELSKGWLQYKIKKKAALALGTQIKNTANIYFDFNAPVVTNTVTNTVEQPNAIKENRGQKSEIRVFPNPTNDVVYIDFGKEVIDAEVTLYNMQGGLLNLTGFKNLQGLGSISLSDLPAGVYFISVATGGNVVRKKVVKW